MEPRYRTILPVLAVVFVIALALVAFFITRKIRTAVTNGSSPSPSAVASDLLMPGASGTIRPGSTQRPGVRQQPVTGPEDQTPVDYTTTIDDQGFHDATVTISAGMKLAWINKGTKAQTLEINGLSSGLIQPNQSFEYQFDSQRTVTITMPLQHVNQTVIVQ